MSTRYVWGKYNISYTETTQEAASNSITYRSGYNFVVGSGYEIVTENGLAYYKLTGTSKWVNDIGSWSTSAIHYYVAPVAFSNMRNITVTDGTGITGFRAAVLYDSQISSSTTTYSWNATVGSSGSVNVRLLKYGATSGTTYTARTLTSQDGQFVGYVSSASAAAYPESGGDNEYRYSYLGSDSVDATAVNYSAANPVAGSFLDVTITPSRNTYGGTISYQYQYSTNGGSTWTNSGNATTATSKTIAVPSNATQFQVRVLASDNLGFTSNDYIYGDNLAVTILATGITLNRTALTMIEGESATLIATVTPSNATDKTVTWSSSDEAIVTVSGGVVTAVDDGTATITATNSAGQNATCVVTVELALTAYFGINNKARSIDKMYIGVNDVAREVTAAYIGVNNIARELF